MDKVQEALRKRFHHIHPLIFARSMEKAKTNGELFDILDTFPDKYPVIWNEESRTWTQTEDLLQSRTSRKGDI